MALKLPKNAEKKPTGSLFLKEEGLYRVTIIENDDKVDDKEDSKRKGYSFHNLKFKLENDKSIFARIYYQNEEGDLVPEGYNFILDLTNIVKRSMKEEGDEKGLRKLEDADSNKVINYMIKEKISFYIATKNSTYQGTDRTNVNTFVSPLGTLEEAEEFAEKKKTKVIHLATETKETAPEANDDDDDL